MVFEHDIPYGGSLLFSLTWSEQNIVANAKFMQKPDIIRKIKDMDFSSNRLFRLLNIVHIDGQFRKQEIFYTFPEDKDRFASDMMDISMGYAILWFFSEDVLGFNEMAVAKTAHNTTNIDADVIGAFLDGIEGIDGDEKYDDDDDDDDEEIPEM